MRLDGYICYNQCMIRRKPQGGFTTIEIILILLIIGVLLTLVITTRSGVQQNQRNSERQQDIKELRDGLETYFAITNRYPTLQELNNDAWRATYLNSLDEAVFRDPSGNNDRFVSKTTPKSYAYTVTSAGGTECGTPQAPCTQYTLTASLEGGGTYTKNNLN